MDFIISLVVILIFVAVSMKKSGQLDEIMNGMKKKKPERGGQRGL